MSVSINVKTDQGLLRQLEALSKLEVVVGVMGSSTDEDSLADIAITHEFGTQGIPARPFLLPTIAENQVKYIGMFSKVLDLIQNGGTAYKGLSIIGNEARADVLDKWKNNNWVPNSKETIARKGSSQPLFDKGHLRNSINYEVRDK